MEVETGIRPIDDSFNLAIFHRMPMNIIDMTVLIFLVFDQIFPESALPNATLTPFCRFFEILSLQSVSRENRPLSYSSESNNRYPKAAVPIGNANDLALSRSR
jgi:hypothetical protein